MLNTADFFSQNAFRILRLSASATYADVLKGSEDMRRASSLDILDEKPSDRVELGPIGRTEADLRAAINRLESPTTRLRDRTFWFHLASQRLTPSVAKVVLDKYPGNPEVQAAVAHDQALEKIALCQLSDNSEATGSAWISALVSWRIVLNDDHYLSLTQNLEERGGFEPPALPSEIEALQSDAFGAVVEHIAALGREAIRSKNENLAKGIVTSLKDVDETWSTKLQHDVLYQATDKIEKACDKIQSRCGSEVVRDDAHERENRAVCSQALNEFRNEVEAEIGVLTRICGPDHDEVRHVSQHASKTLQLLASSFTWAEEFEKSQSLLQEALKYDVVGLWRNEIEEGLERVGSQVIQKKVLSPLRPISSAPTLYSINGFGFTLYGRSEYDSFTKSHVAVYYFIGLFIPIFPICRYRVIEDSIGRFRFLGKLPLRPFDKIHLLGVLGGIVITALTVIAQDQTKSRASVSPPRTDTYRPTVTSTPAPPSRPSQSQLTELKYRIEMGRKEISDIEARTQGVNQRIEQFKSQMQGYKAELARLDALGPRRDPTYYNSVVDKHNAALQSANTLYDANKPSFDRYNALLEADKNMVQQYNALLKR